jgi:capsular exopolysaccharide synthesis family protein
MSELIPTNGHPVARIEARPFSQLPPAHERESALEMREVLAVLRRRALLIAAVAMVVTGLTAAVVLTSQRLYKAQATVRLADARRALTGGLDGQVSERIPGAYIDPILSHIQVLQSRGVAIEAVRREPLLRLSASFPVRHIEGIDLGDSVAYDTLRFSFLKEEFVVRARDTLMHVDYGDPVQLEGLTFAIREAPEKSTGFMTIRSAGAAAAMVSGSVSARQRRGTDVLDVEFIGPDPFIAQRAVNAMVAAFQQVNTEGAQQQSRRRRLFIQEQLAQTEAQLTSAQEALTAHKSGERVYGSRERLAAEQSGLMNLDIRREELESDRKVYNALLARLHAPREGTDRDALRALVASPGLSSSPVVSQLYGQLAQYETRRDSLLSGQWGRSRTDPDVQRLDTLVHTTERKLDEAVRSQITALDARIAALADLRDRNLASLQSLPAAEATEARLIQGVETTRRLADQLREEFQRARIAEAVEAGQVELIDAAAMPRKPIGRRRATLIGSGLVAGLLFGIGLAFLVEHLYTAIRRREDIEQQLHVPGLAVIPQIGTVSALSRFRIGRVTLPRALTIGNGRRDAAYTNGRALVTISNIQGVEAEAYRTLRTNLIFSQAIRTLRTIVVTSPSPQDGKTTTAANLAVTFAQQGLRVVIIDCDLRKARLHNVFGLSREPGLTQLILGLATRQQVVQPTKVENLWVITSGMLPPNPSELLGGDRMRQTVASLATDYDVVIMDTPPVHVAADSAILGALADGVLLVLRAGQTERHSAQDALERLGRVGARVVGAVLNDPDHKVPAYGGYYHYEYYEKA